MTAVWVSLIRVYIHHIDLSKSVPFYAFLYIITIISCIIKSTKLSLCFIVAMRARSHFVTLIERKLAVLIVDGFFWILWNLKTLDHPFVFSITHSLSSTTKLIKVIVWVGKKYRQSIFILKSLVRLIIARFRKSGKINMFQVVHSVVYDFSNALLPAHPLF